MLSVMHGNRAAVHSGAGIGAGLVGSSRHKSVVARWYLSDGRKNRNFTLGASSLRAPMRGGQLEVSDSNDATLRDARAGGCDGLSKPLKPQRVHEAFLWLDGVSDSVQVRSPTSYFFRLAINAASGWRTARDRVSASEVDALLGAEGEAFDPARAAAAHPEIEVLKKALVGLSPRQRQILLAAIVEEAPVREIAARLGMRVRTVQRDLAHALKYCAQSRFCPKST
jgi:RNA polymerase sigma-70 factor, ECF subfamily